MPLNDSEELTTRLRIRVCGEVEAEIASAEAWEAGASGVTDEGAGLGDAIELIAYLPAARAPELRAALVMTLADIEIGPSEIVVEEAWAETWKKHLKPIEVSERLVVRPSFAPVELSPGQAELIIDPGQAFGTGAHHSTRLALECLDLRLSRVPASTVLDVGTGSGVLALAALCLGAKSATGFDLDPLAEPAAVDAAQHNGLAQSFDCMTGGIDDVADGVFDVVVANLLLRELLPIVESVAQRVAEGGALVLAGLLARDVDSVLEAFAASRPAFALESRLERIDADGEVWVGVVLVAG
ncbi:MAG: 50S ribosomal protein L11 methyltransferase [Myxococcota bacterium]|nr:50S ribosomal protein L11 methyltransferase [Myxococcota bacterium]